MSLVEAEEPGTLFHPPPYLQMDAHVKDMTQYQRMYEESVNYPNEFWRRIASEFYWKNQIDATHAFLDEHHYKDQQAHAKTGHSKTNFDVRNGPISIKFMEGATTNICYNALDRNVERGFGNKVAYFWEGNNPSDEGRITYAELLDEVCRFANVLKSFDLQKGDRVAIYLPMILELPIAMLACARIGLVHSVVFGGFSAESLAERMLDGHCSVLITADGVWRGNKFIDLKEIADDACHRCAAHGHKITKKIIIKHMGCIQHSNGLANGNGHAAGDPLDRIDPYCKKTHHKELVTRWDSSVDSWYHEEVAKVSNICPPVWMDAEDPLFMLYTSGSTGKPKGVQHSTGGYMVYTAFTFKCVFDYHDDDIYWCTADAGWITGHSYVVYGPLLNGATGIVFEGIPTHPHAGRYWEVVQKYGVTKFYTAPTAIRSLMKFGEELVLKYDRHTLKVLGTVGEPINPEAWLWYHKYVGDERCPIVDTFWQTETGGHVLTPLPCATPLKPGSATLPFFGVVPAILDENGKELTEPDAEGYLVFKRPWPGIMRTVYGDHKRYEDTYFRKFPGYYTTGDGAKRDADGYYWITGRIDDMVNVSGHLLSTAEIESALVEHPGVAEAAVVSHPHKIKGECTYGFVTMKDGYNFTPQVLGELKHKVRDKIGAFAVPDFLQDAPALPKTRSGKIMRRILRKIAVGDRSLGDTSTLAEPGVVDVLFKLRPADA
ncbi:acetyl-coenzyme A synthetase-like [Paramacrobiotus metropolitanus]|uniref:acetyl-coenzyme A synthetase-like n=1 Tax=Paramacrobiotus metropolitanus TaxID=2943436 RepID=UPI002445C8A0|nr:acetyl-coenzyme A synthetase-like [Paramacrobiotus metropolitanus]